MTEAAPYLGSYYFGCWRQSGHFLFREGMTSADRDVSRKSLGRLDGGYVPKTYAQGHARLTDLPPYTILSFPDYSVDSRPGSHSTFVLRGKHGFDDAIAEARRLFPQVFERYTFEIQEAQ